MDRREFVRTGIGAFAGIGAAAALAACGGDDGVTDPGDGGGDGGGNGGGGGDPLTVNADDNFFSPTGLDVDVGETVTWENVGSNPHTVTPDGHSEWSDVTLQPGETFQHTFDTAGDYPYICRFHAGMDGSISVAESTS